MIKDIAQGHINEIMGHNKDIAKTRMEICQVCPIYSPKWGGLCNDKLWIDPKTNDVSFEERDGYVQGCGCRLKAKATLPYAACIAGKW